jgi:hypothetical protein
MPYEGREGKPVMKSKLLIAFTLLASASAFAQTRFSIRIGGGYGPSYYAPPSVYYAPAQPYYRSYGYAPGWSGAGYWGEDPERQHERAEWYGLRQHHDKERMMYGDSPELREHQAHEQLELRHEQWHERNGDYSAGEGRAHGSARDGLHDQYEQPYHQH